jgi:hypothetical protein
VVAGAYPIQGLRRGVYLIVVLSFGKCGHLMHILGEPFRFVGQIDKAILDGARDGVHPHDLVHGGTITRPAVEAVSR